MCMKMASFNEFYTFLKVIYEVFISYLHFNTFYYIFNKENEIKFMNFEQKKFDLMMTITLIAVAIFN